MAILIFYTHSNQGQGRPKRKIGDMLLTEKQFNEVVLGKRKRLNPMMAAFRNGMAEERNQWADGVIPVAFEKSIGESCLSRDKENGSKMGDNTAKNSRYIFTGPEMKKKIRGHLKTMNTLLLGCVHFRKKLDEDGENYVSNK